MSTPKIGIFSVTVRRLWNLGHYENAAIEATATVNPGEDAAAICTELRAWVDSQGPRKDRWGSWTWDPEHVTTPEDQP